MTTKLMHRTSKTENNYNCNLMTNNENTNTITFK